MRICVTCGRTAGDRPLERLDIAMSPDLGICHPCKDRLGRRGVRSGIQRESDRILSTDKSAFLPYLPKEMCHHCGEVALVYNANGKMRPWCSACERRRMQIATRGR